MNTQHQDYESRVRPSLPDPVQYENRIRPEPPDPVETTSAAVRAESVQEHEAPDAVQAADTDREQRALETGRPTRGVDWVRASDLLARGSGALSRRSIDFEARLGYGARHGIAVAAKATGRSVVNAAKRLPPVSSFGREEPTVEPQGLGRA